MIKQAKTTVIETQAGTSTVTKPRATAKKQTPSKTLEPASTEVPMPASGTSETTPPAPKKSRSRQTATPKTPTAETQAKNTVQVLTMQERVGLTAGNIWRHLAEHGPTSVNQLLNALAEEEKVIQRSLGWLAQEGKLKFEEADKDEIAILVE